MPDPVSLFGKRLLVTGAARGIGRAVADLALEAGASVYATDVGEDFMSGLAGDTRIFGEAWDLTEVDGLDGLCRRAADALGGLDGLVHVAGVIVRRDSLDEVTEADWDLQTDVNLKATFFLDRAASRVMENGGAIVNFTSQGWWTGGFGGSVVYAAGKGGVVSLTRGLARSLAPRSIRVNAVAPGAVDTAMMQDMTTEARDAFVAQIPLGRMGAPEELAHAALFLVSDQSAYITGATLNVSGGQLMY